MVRGMAGFIAMSVALSRLTTVRCPHCGQEKKVERGRKVKFRVCTRCKQRFEDPPAARPRKR
jgi:transcription elongation factor Elf1